MERFPLLTANIAHFKKTSNHNQSGLSIKQTINIAHFKKTSNHNFTLADILARANIAHFKKTSNHNHRRYYERREKI